MTVYVGKDVTVKVQTPVKDEIETSKLLRLLFYTFTERADNKAYHHSASSEPSPPFGAELTDSEYEKIQSSNDTRYSKSTGVNGEYAMMLFRYKCPFSEADVKKIVVKFEGYGTSPAGNGVTMKIWNHVNSAWENEQTGTGSGDETLTITLTSNIPDYIDDDGYIWVLARTTNPSDGTTEAVLHCDQAYGYVTRAKFTVNYTPISDRDQDGVADEPAHVTVKVNGVEVAVSSVDDSTGLVTLASGDFNEGDVITCTYRFDFDPYIAQEIRIEPKQRIEGLDGLGSDTVQAWAVLQKEIGGSIRETFKPGSIEQTSRFMRTVIYEPFNSDDGWEVKSGSWTIENGEYHGVGLGEAQLKALRLRDFCLRVKVHGEPGWKTGIKFRIQDGQNFYRAIYGAHYDDEKYYVRLDKVVNGGENIIKKSALKHLGSSHVYTLDLIVKGNRIIFCIDGVPHIDVEDSEFPSAGPISLYLDNYADVYFDDLEIVSPPNRLGEYGMIITWDQAGQAVKVGLDGVVFPEGSIPSPKNSPVFTVTPFKARRIKTIG